MVIDLNKLVEATRERDEAIATLAKVGTVWRTLFHIAIGMVFGIASHPLVTDLIIWSGTNAVDYVFTVTPVIR